MKHKYTDNKSCMQVIGNVYQNPTLLDNETYFFSEEDFTENIHSIIFGAIYMLHRAGVKNITIPVIEDYLQTHTKKYADYKTNNGAKWLEEAIDKCQIAGFDYYYHRMKKMTLMRVYNERAGLDLSWLYDVDNLFDDKKREAQERWFDNTTEQEIGELIDNRVQEIKIKYINNTDTKFCEAGEGISELIERLQKYPEVGVPLYGDVINAVVRGARLKKFYLRSGETGLGKAIPNNTIIPTPIGFRKVEDIKLGDFLFGQDGKPTKVLRVFPQPNQKDVWKITFSDGRTAECCGEHLWEYRYYSHDGYKYRVEDCQTIYNRAMKMKNNFKNSIGKGFRFHIRLNDPVEYEEKIFSVDPYVMGALLGDGSFRYSNKNKAITFSSGTDELPNKISDIIGWEPHKNSDCNYSYTFQKDGHNLWVEEILVDYPDLWQTKSETKFIPQEYLQGSISQRMDLLRGLLDTDGHIDKKGRVSYTTVSPYLRDGMIELCRSLGMITSCIIDKREEKYTTGEAYTVIIQAKKKIKPEMFSLSHKHQIAIEYANSEKREEWKDHLAIVNIEKTNQKTNMTCFEVDNKDHLFLMNDFITTHNSRTMIADACTIACKEFYQNGRWIKNRKTDEPTLYITTEQELDEIQTMMLAFVSGVNEDHIIYNKYKEGEIERVIKAAEILKDSKIYVKELPDFNLSDIENTIRFAVREYNVRYVFHDYIHSSLKILGEVAGRAKIQGLREDNVLFMISVKFKDLCNELGIFLLSATQLSNEYHNARVFDQGLLQGAKSIANKVDVGMIMLYATEEDKTALAGLCQQNGWDLPTIKISVYKNRRGRYNRLFIWCKEDRGTCRIDPIFVTKYDFTPLEIPPLKIDVEERQSVF